MIFFRFVLWNIHDVQIFVRNFIQLLTQQNVHFTTNFG